MEQIKDETWRDVVGFENYYMVSDLGRIKSKPRVVNSRYGKHHTIFERLLTQFPDKLTGYVNVNFCISHKRFSKSVHRLVAMAFLPNVEDKCCVNHIDGNNQNNLLTNLEWVTHSENSLHSEKLNLRRTKKYWNKDEVKSLIWDCLHTLEASFDREKLTQFINQNL